MLIATEPSGACPNTATHCRRWLIFVLCVLCFVSTSFRGFANAAGAGKSVLEKVEWTWADSPAKADSALPNVLLVGDSITRGYFPEVTSMMSGRANVYLFATSAAAGDPRLLKQLNDYFAMEPLPFVVIHFNNGMHGWGYSDHAYATALPAMLRHLQKDSPHSKLIWGSTTPVHKTADSGASNERIDARNAAALRMMKSAAIPVDDQHLLMLGHDDLHSDNVHYKAEGSRLQAAQVVQMLESKLPRRVATPNQP